MIKKEAPDIRPDPNTMMRIGGSQKQEKPKRWWLVSLMIASLLCLIWGSSYLLMVADVPYWTKGPIAATSLIFGVITIFVIIVEISKE